MSSLLRKRLTELGKSRGYSRSTINYQIKEFEKIEKEIDRRIAQPSPFFAWLQKPFKEDEWKKIKRSK